MKPYKFFICYRRDDKELARSIERRLVEEFGKNSVFLDVESIYAGQEWEKSLETAFKGDPIVITLITTKWNSRRRGAPKLMDTKDHVRFELETALERGLTIVPVVYESAKFPKENQIPSSLHPLLRFQNIPFSYARWGYDTDRLVSALRDLLVEESKEEPVKATSGNFYGNPINKSQNLTFNRSMFTLSPEQKKQFAERAKREEERLARARAESPAFYKRPSFWFSIVVTFILSGGSVLGAEVLAQMIGEKIGILLFVPTFPGLLLAGIWSLVWIFLGAGAYHYDPEPGAGIFYTKGILGGWILGFWDFEPIGYWAAFPLSTTVLWIVARVLSMLSAYYLHWDYLLVFWIVIGAYTLPVLIRYCLYAADEWL